jgi:hypothetical protein
VVLSQDCQQSVLVLVLDFAETDPKEERVQRELFL